MSNKKEYEAIFIDKPYLQENFKIDFATTKTRKTSVAIWILRKEWSTTRTNILSHNEIKNKLDRRPELKKWTGDFTIDVSRDEAGIKKRVLFLPLGSKTSYQVNNECAEELMQEDLQNRPGTLIYGVLRRKRIRVCAIYLDPDPYVVSSVSKKIIPVGVPGLDKLLFPHSKSPRGFDNPQRTDKIVPKIVLIKGAPGTGKTTIAIQMLVKMASCGFNCSFWSTSNDQEAIADIAKSYEFCGISEFKHWLKHERRIFIKKIGIKPLPELRLNSIIPKNAPRKTEVLFIDALNVAQGHIDRTQIWELFENYHRKNLLVFFLLEDYGNDATQEVRQLIGDCEFFADIVIDLGEDEYLGYHRWAMKIKKKHYGAQTYGSHLYKICRPGHALSNLDKNSGIVTFPSIHRYLSSTRSAFEPYKLEQYVQTGITHLDEIFQGEKDACVSNNSMAPDSCIVITGRKGGHKLPLGMNLLMGGMWGIQKKKSNFAVSKNKDVLVILLDEEANIDVPRAAMAKETHKFTKNAPLLASLDNGEWINWARDCNTANCQLNDLCNEEENEGKKVFFKKWCARIGKSNECSKLVVAGFRPGCITPEEFLNIISTLLNNPDQAGPSPFFSRVLFISTAHLQMRFPLLYKEKLFVPALVDLFKSQRVVSIFINVEGEGSNTETTFGLAALADYLIHVDAFTSEERSNINVMLPRGLGPSSETIIPELKDNEKGYIWSRMQVENVRGKEYSRVLHALTVRPDDRGNANKLYILDIEDPHPFAVKINELFDTP